MKKTIKTPAGIPAVAGLKLNYFIGKGERARSFSRRICVLAVWLGLMFIGTNVALLGVQTTHAATNSISVDFNAAGELTGLFNDGYAAPAWSQNTTGGISGSGGITIPNGSNDLYICKQGFPVQAGATYTVSAYYFNEYDAGYGGLGFTTLTSGTINGGYCTPLSAIGVSFHGGGGYMDNNSATTSSATTENWNTSYATVTSWFYFKETLNFTGSNTFSQTFEIWQCDTNGNLGTKFTTTTVTGQINATLGAASVIYPFFGASQSRFIAADIFTATTTATGAAATITAQPANQVVAVGGTVNLSVMASGTGPLAYQWLKNGGMVLGATNSALSMTNAGVTNSGTYCVVVTNAYGLNISQPVTVTVGNPQLLAWGDNSNGELGDGTTTQRNSPESVASNVVVAAAGESHSLYLAGDGTLWVMGDNSAGELGDGTTIQRNSPVAVIGGSNVVSVAAGTDYSLFVKADGTLWAMGDNSAGELGDGTTIQRNSPESVASNVVSVAAGFIHTLFLKRDGTLWAMGNNAEGQLGDGTTTQRNSPVAVIGGSNVVAMAAGSDHSLYLKSDGTLWAMGLNNYGQLGDGTTTQQSSPECVASNVTAAAAGYSHSLYSKSDGTLWAMGDNSAGELGDGTATQQDSPVAVIRGSNVVSVAAGWYYSVYLKNDGTMWAMGDNSSGSLGDGTTTSTNLPVRVPGISLATAVSSCNSWHTLAVGQALPPGITSQPTNQTVMAGSPATFTVTADGFQSLSYQWQINGTNLPSATNTSYTIPSVALTDAGSYAVIVTNNYGSIISTTAILTVTATVTVSANPTDAGTVTGGGVYLVGSNAVLTATASNNWQFVNWNDGSTDNLRVITVPATNITYTANFGAAATITVTASPNNGGSVAGGGTFLIGSTNLVTAVAFSGWVFVQWSDGTTNNLYLITVPATNSTYTAQFAATATITVSANPNAGGAVTGGGTFLIGSTNLITAAASNGWIFVGWSDGITNNPRLIVVTSNLTLTANFDPAATVTTVALPAEGGSTAGDGTYAIGSSATVTATASNGWFFLNWNGTVTNYIQTGNTNNPLEFTITSNITVTANFAQVTTDGFVYTVINNNGTQQAEIIGYNGPTTDTIVIPSVIGGLAVTTIGTGAFWWNKCSKIVIPDSVDAIGSESINSGIIEFAGGADAALPLIADGAFAAAGEVILDYAVPAAALAGMIGVLADIFSDLVTVEATASPDSGGYCTGSGLYMTGSSVEITATANDGWQFTNWNDGNTNHDRWVTAPGTYEANFVQRCTVTVLANPTSDAGTVTGSGTYDVGTMVTITATAEEGWEFSDWSDETTNPTNTFQMPNHDVTYTANFEVEVEGEAEPPTGGLILGNGSYPEGTIVPLTAIPNTGWRFNGWFLEGVSSNSCLTNFTTVLVAAYPLTPPLEYKAHFEQTIQVIGLANPTNAGSVAGSGVYDIDDTNITLTATASNNWRFINWNDGTTNNPYTIPPITVTNITSITYTANFAQISTVTVLVNPTNAGSVTGGGTYFVGSNVVLTATASNNWQFINWNDGTTNNPYNITVPATNITYTACFGATATITVEANPTNSGSVGGGGTFLVGSTNLITAAASSGWVFARWNDGTTNNPYSIVVTSNQTYSANFEAAATVTTVALPPDGGTTAGDGTYAIGSSVTVTATASTNWLFLNWNGTVTNYTTTGNQNNPLSFTVTTNITQAANFGQVTNGFVFLVLTNYNPPQVEIIGYVGPTNIQVVIPLAIDGFKVTIIGPGAFWNNGVTNIVITGNITNISSGSIAVEVVEFVGVAAGIFIAADAFKDVLEVDLVDMSADAIADLLEDLGEDLADLVSVQAHG